MNPRSKNLALTALVLALTCAAAVDSHAQGATVRGVVEDDSTGRVLLGANVILRTSESRDVRTTSDVDGRFTFANVSAGDYVLIVSFIGFQTVQDSIRVSADGESFHRVALGATQTELNEVVIETVRLANDRFVPGLKPIDPNALARIPMPDVTYDLAGYLQSIPGFVSTGDRGGQLYVRGGTPTQNLVLLDGIPLYQPFHIVGFYSAVPADIISYGDVYAGGFGAQYGGRISSVIDITTRNADKSRTKASGSIAPFLSGLRLELPLDKKDVSLLLSIRESVIERFAPDLLGQELPFRFGDAFGKFHANLTPTSSVSVTGLQTHDEGNILAKTNVDEPDDQLSKWKNKAYGVRYIFLPPDYPAIFEFAAHYTNLESTFRLTQDEIRSSTARGFGFRMRYHYLLGDTQVHVGIYGSLNRFTYRLNPNQRPELQAVTSGGAFFDTRFLIGNHLRIEPGMRLESFSHGVAMAVGPRLRLIFLPEGRLSRHQLSAAWGRYHQQVIGLNNEQDVSDVFTIWSASPQNAAVPKATHLIAGYRGRFLPWLEVTVEGYRKWLQNLAFPVFPEDVEGRTDFSRVSGTAQGIDFKVDVDTRALYMSLSYSLADVTYRRKAVDQRIILVPGVETTQTFDSQDFSPPHDRRHQINTTVQYENSLGRFSVRWQFGSGLPFTQVNGYYNRFDPAAISQPGELTGEGNLYVSRSKLYRERLPTYHRLDISYERTFSFERVRATLQLGAINLYDRSNIFSYNIFTGDRVDQFPLIPSMGIKVEVD